MDYDDVVAAMMGPRLDGAPVPEVVARPTPARRLRDATEPLAMHAVWSRMTNESLAGLGLDFLQAYILGRASSLGDPIPEVVASTFAWFEPGMLAGVYRSARALVDLDSLVELRARTTGESLGAVLAGEDVASVADRLCDAVVAADGTGRPLFSGLRARGRPDNPLRRLWWACDLVREHRGDTHVAVVLASGLDAVEMNVLTELWLGMPLYSYSSTRGWPPDQLTAGLERLERRGWVQSGRITVEGDLTRSRLEAQTDFGEQSIVEALGIELDDLCARLDGWSSLCIKAAAFPADILKRAAG